MSSRFLLLLRGCEGPSITRFFWCYWLRSSHAGFYLTDGSDLTDGDESITEHGDHEELGATYGKNTRMMLEKFQALLRFNHKQLNCSQSRCSRTESGPAGFARPARARA